MIEDDSDEFENDSDNAAEADELAQLGEQLVEKGRVIKIIINNFSFCTIEKKLRTIFFKITHVFLSQTRIKGAV